MLAIANEGGAVVVEGGGSKLADCPMIMFRLRLLPPTPRPPTSTRPLPVLGGALGLLLLLMLAAEVVVGAEVKLFEVVLLPTPLCASASTLLPPRTVMLLIAAPVELEAPKSNVLAPLALLVPLPVPLLLIKRGLRAPPPPPPTASVPKGIAAEGAATAPALLAPMDGAAELKFVVPPENRFGVLLAPLLATTGTAGYVLLVALSVAGKEEESVENGIIISCGDGVFRGKWP